MTVICVKDGIMACDSAVSQGLIRCGSTDKWMRVPSEHGGGFLAWAGEAGTGYKAATQFCAEGPTAGIPSGVEMLHLREDGSLWNGESDAWFRFDAPFQAIGGGREFALGAMAAGASAAEAARLTCEWVEGCRAPVAVLQP